MLGKTAKSPKPGAKTAAGKAAAKKTAAPKTTTQKPAAKKPAPAKAPAKQKQPAGKKPSPAAGQTSPTRTRNNRAAPSIKKAARKAVTTDTPSTALKKSTSSSTRKTPAAETAGTAAPATTAKAHRATGSKRKSHRHKTGRRAAFTLEEVLEIAKNNERRAEKTIPTSAEVEAAAAATKEADLKAVRQEQRVLGAASLADILGYNPNGGKTPMEDEEDKIQKKYLRYYRILVDLRNHVNSEISLHTEDTLKRSSKEDSGDLSSYSQHIADAGTDTFDRDFALSLVSSEQEALYEIEEAIKRIKAGTYGVCELTGKPIAKERLLAVPFARYSVESQAQVEKTRKRNVQRGGIFGDAAADGANGFISDDSDD